MNKNAAWIILGLLTLALWGCGQKLPESYGVYSDTDKGLIALQSQKILFSGNLMNAITGIKNASGAECNSINHFIVYEKDMNPEAITLSRLEFKKGDSVQSPFGSNYVTINLWVSARKIDVDKSPITEKPGMYKLTFKTKLEPGFYAIHYGGLNQISTIEASAGNFAYDIVIGKASDYPSHEAMKVRIEERITTEANILLKAMSDAYNNRNLSKMRDVYWPNGQAMTDSELNNFVKGQDIWMKKSGKILEAKIAKADIPDEHGGLFQIATTYELKGTLEEKMGIRKLNDKYYVTYLE
jgi:hypothetical protein